MKSCIWALLLIVALCFLISVPAMAQDPPATNTAYVGTFVNQDNQVRVSGAFRKLISGPIYSLTLFDVTNITFMPLNISHPQINSKEYVTAKIPLGGAFPDWFSLWGLGGAGITGTKDVSITGAFGAGISPEVILNKQKKISMTAPILYNKSSMNALTGWEARLHIGIGW